MRLTNRLIIFSLSFIGFVFGQLYPSASFSAQYDDNIFRSPQIYSDQIYNFGVGLEYAFDSSPVSIYYNGSFDFFKTYTDRNSNYHTFGLSYYSFFGKDDKNNLSFGLEYEQRVNDEIYSSYDYSQFLLYGDVKYKELMGGIFKAGYSYRYRNYINYTSINNSLHELYSEYIRSFPTRTTFVLYADLGLKGYVNYVEETSAPVVYGPHRPGRPGGGSTIYAESQYLSNFSFRLKVAQSIFDFLGINAYYHQQFSLIPNSKALNSDITNQDPELYNDPFSYESYSFGGGVTALLPWNINLKAGTSQEKRDYISQQAYISETDTVGLGGSRFDTENSLFVSVDKNVVIESSWLYSVFFYFDYYFTDNRSNSYWYDYRDNFYRVGINFNF